MTVVEIVELYLAASEVIDAVNRVQSCPDAVERLALHNLVGLESLGTMLMTEPIRTPADRRALAALVAFLIGQCANDGAVPELCLARLAVRLGEDFADDLVDG